MNLLRIVSLPKKLLVGQQLEMSISANRTFELWSSFMPIQKELSNKVDQNFYSIQVYPHQPDFSQFNPNAIFTKWAAVEVTDFANIPDNLKPFTLQGGLYAVFLHKGDTQAFMKNIQSIFGEWLPNAEYQLDHRPHFELLGEKYKNNDPNSEEEIWIPIRPK